MDNVIVNYGTPVQRETGVSEITTYSGVTKEIIVPFNGIFINIPTITYDIHCTNYNPIYEATVTILEVTRYSFKYRLFCRYLENKALKMELTWVAAYEVD